MDRMIDGGTTFVEERSEKELRDKLIEEGLVISYNKLLKLNPDLVKPEDFSGKTIKEVVPIPGFKYFGSNDEDPAIIFIFEDGTKSAPVAGMKKISFTECSYDSLIEAWILLQENKKKAIKRLTEIFALKRKKEKLVEQRQGLIKDLENFGLKAKVIHSKVQQIHKIEKEILSLTTRISGLYHQ